MLWLYIVSGIFGGATLVLLFIRLNNGWLQTTGYSVETGLEKSVKIVHLSDLHGKLFGRENARLIARVVKEAPDFIAVTGDIIHKYRDKDKRVAVELVSALCAAAPVLYVSGNHEMRNKGYRFFRKDLIEAGATVLDNCSANICGLTVVGLNCASLENGTVNKITPGCRPKILLAHMPQYIDAYSAAGYDLVLCGHAHGGQWRIPFTGIGIYAPQQGIFPKLTAGVHTRGNTKTVISRGLGNSKFPLRLFNRPEIVVINIA